MAGASPQTDSPEPKRRKVRKGTQNCWECKRRKVRCVFTPADAICNNCKRRGTACIGQDLPDEPSSPNGVSQLDTRLGRIEGFIEHLVSSAGIAAIPPSPSKHLSQVDYTRPEPFSESHALPSATSSVHSRPASARHEGLSRALIAAWPGQRDLDIIRALPVGLSAHVGCVMCMPYCNALMRDPKSPQMMLQLPRPGSHPVLIARALLLLGIVLQGVLPSSFDALPDRGAHYRDVMSRAVEAAVTLVTTDEDLICSVEGIECILLEATYLNYSGNTRRAWMAVRRATSVAQVMSLHRGLRSPSLDILEPEKRAVFDPDPIYFRLEQMGCYLSLTLGLPWNSLEAHLAGPDAMKECEPIDRMQRIHCLASERVLQRTENSLSESLQVDALLQKAAAEIPPQWWLVPSLSPSSTGTGTQAVDEIVKLMCQFSHYHLLILLHLPYMLRASSDHRYDHSKITAVNASRDVLTRFMAFRASNPAHFYCRGLDFLAFISTTVLCVAHIDSCVQRRTNRLDPSPGDAFNYLAHSRPSDRGMMERTFDIIESLTSPGPDAIATKIVNILRNLLSIEAKAASGASYSTNSSKGDNEEPDCHGKSTNGDNDLQIHVPYFGTINFERRAVTRTGPGKSNAPDQHPSTASAPEISPASHSGEQTRQALPDMDRLHTDTQPLTLNDGQLPSSQRHASTNNVLDGFSNGYFQQDNPQGFPELADAESDWGLQGVDLAFFDSLFRGAAIPDAAEETWTQWASDS